ncbi:MAG TPA: response regulator [Enhygromyxa sp.]|nr:response regulator [Enhygromyxa sp.]
MADRRPVLCVEDNDANYALIQRVLESTGRWAVTRASRVEQARALLERQTPAVLVLDLDLPGIGGLELARELKSSERWRSLPIVVVSASVMKQEQQRARAAGCEYFVEKPFDIDHLRSVVAKAAGPVT